MLAAVVHVRVYLFAIDMHLLALVVDNYSSALNQLCIVYVAVFPHDRCLHIKMMIVTHTCTNKD